MVKGLLVLVILIIVIAPFTLAYDLSDFPKSFIENEKFNVVGIIGAKSASSDVITITDLFTTLAKNHNIRPYKSLGCPEGTVCINLPRANYDLILDEDLINLHQNMILVGGPCANKITAQIMNISYEWPECATSFENGTGRIMVYNKWNKTQLVIAGYSAEDTFKTANVVEKYNKYNLSGKEIEVLGMIDNLSVKRVITEEEKRYCEKDDDCVFYSCSCCPVCNPPSLNKKYLPDCNLNCSRIACIQSVCILQTYPKCIDNRCKSVSLKYCESNNDCISSKPWGCISKGLCKIFNEMYKNGKSEYPCPEVRNESCQCINNECPNELI